jgi:hypothetical protein
LAIEKDAVARLKVFGPPLAFLVRDFNVLTADVLMLDGDVAGIGAADSERSGEFTADRRFHVANGDANNGSFGRYFHDSAKTRKLILAENG